MHINQLLIVLRFIIKEIEKNNIIKQFEYLFELIENSTEDKELTVNKIDEVKSSLINSINSCNPANWENNYSGIFHKLDKAYLLGSEAEKKLTEIFEKNKTGLQDLLNETKNVYNDFIELTNHLNQLISGIEPLTKSKEIDFNEKEEKLNLLQVVFEEAQFIENIEDLEKFCRIWGKILNAFTTLTDEIYEEIKIYDIESTSITFYAGFKTIKSITDGVVKILKEFNKIQQIRYFYSEIDKIEISKKDEIKLLLQEEETIQIGDITYNVSEQLLSEYNWLGKDDADNVFKQIQISLKQILNFVERGGIVSSAHSYELTDLIKNCNSNN